MKKILLIFFALFPLTIICIYFFIPAKINFGKVIYINGNINIANRYISDESKWGKWWPFDVQDSLSTGNINSEMHYSYKNYSYTISRKALEGTSILIEHNSNRINSFLHIIALNTDSVAIEWKGELPDTYNPFKKITNYLLATGVKKNISEILQSAKFFLENKEDIYGLSIIQQKVKDTLLISTRYTSNSYPSIATIYNLIKSLKEYILLNGAAETNYPMLNVTQDTSVFKTMVAIPINRVIPQNEKFLLKRMVPGKILVTEVKGGTYTASEALRQLKTYMDDNHLSSPAIPFQSLVTDRSKEADTAKWVTKIYYPSY